MPWSRENYFKFGPSQTNVLISADGRKGDLLECIEVIPARTNCGVVRIRDGATGTLTTVFAGGGTVALKSRAPFKIRLGIRSRVGGWRITTGAQLQVFVSGSFT